MIFHEINMNLFLYLFALLSIALSDILLLSEGYSLGLTDLGAIRYTKSTNLEKHSIIYTQDLNTLSTQLIERLHKKVSQNSGYNLKDINCEAGDGPDYFRFLPQFQAAIFPGQSPILISTKCFSKVKFEISKFTEDTLEITIIPGLTKQILCVDTFFIGILNQIHLDTIEVLSKHKIEFKNLSYDDIFDIKQNGIRIFTFCDGIKDLLIDIAMTLQLFAGGFSTNPSVPIVGSHTTW